MSRTKVKPKIRDVLPSSFVHHMHTEFYPCSMAVLGMEIIPHVIPLIFPLGK